MYYFVLINFVSLIDYPKANHPIIMAASLRRFLSISLSSSSSSSLSSTSSLDTSILHRREVNSSRNYSKWKIPSQTIESIYLIGPLSFKTAFSIKIHEETISLNDQFKTFQLLSIPSINKSLQNGFRYIHFRLVQVVVRPLTKLGIYAPVFLALRDNRLITYQDSLLVMVQSISIIIHIIPRILLILGFFKV